LFAGGLVAELGVELSRAGGSGDQYELPESVGVLTVAFGAAFLVGEVLRGFVTPLFCTLVILGAELCTGALMVGMAPNRADRLSDMLDLAILVLLSWN